MNISTLSIKRYVATFLIFVTLIFMGIFFSSQMKISYYPDFSAPVFLIMTPYRSATPLQVEQEVTKIIEQAIVSAEGVDEIESISSEGFSNIIARLKWNADTKESKESIREKIDFIIPDLPRDAGKPSIMDINTLIPPPVEISISSDKLKQAELKELIEDEILIYFQKLENAGLVELFGGREKYVAIKVDNRKLRKYNLTPSIFSNILRGDNIDYPLGVIKLNKKEFLVKLSSKFSSPEDVANLAIGYYKNIPLKIKDVAYVDFKIKEPESIYKVNGEEAVAVSIRKKTDGNSVKLCDEAKEIVKDLEKKYKNINFQITKDESVFIKNSISTVVVNAILGGLLAAIVIIFFLRSIRNFLIISISIPATIVSTFVLMKIFNLSINTISLGGLALAVGIVVDASIVVLENLTRNIQLKKEKSLEVFKTASTEVVAAVVASILTSIVVFLPLAFLKGIASVLLGELALTVVFALVLSALVALSLIPTLSYFFMKVRKENRLSKLMKKAQDSIINFYEILLRKVIKKKLYALTVVLVSFLLLFFSFTELKNIDFTMLPSADLGEYRIELEAAPGTTLRTSEEITNKISRKISELPYIANLSQVIGKGATYGEEGTNLSYIFVRLEDSEKRKSTGEYIDDTINIINKMEIPGLSNFLVRQLEATQGVVNPPLDVNLYGDDLKTLKSLSEKMIKKFDKIPGVVNLESSIKPGKKEINIIPKKDKLRFYNYSPFSLGQDIKTYFDELKIGEVNIEDKKYDLSIIQNTYEPSFEDIYITPALSVSLPITELADYQLRETPFQIKRFNFQRFVEITGDLLYGKQRDLTKKVNKILEEAKFPDGYSAAERGTSEGISESFKTLGYALIIAIFLVYVVMASQFNSFFQPFIISFTIPLAFIGVFWGLSITRTPLSMNSFLGIIVLAGIVVNNGILLIDFINQRRIAGVELKKSIVEGSKLRLRPILMTAFTTMFGMFPLAISKGIGAESLAPLAIAVISGLLTSTVFTPFVIPSLYLIFSRKK